MYFVFYLSDIISHLLKVLEYCSGSFGFEILYLTIFVCFFCKLKSMLWYYVKTHTLSVTGRCDTMCLQESIQSCKLPTSQVCCSPIYSYSELLELHALYAQLGRGNCAISSQGGTVLGLVSTFMQAIVSELGLLAFLSWCWCECKSVFVQLFVLVL